MKDRDKIKSIRYEGGWILDIGYKYVWDSIHLKLFIFTHESFFLLLLGFFFFLCLLLKAFVLINIFFFQFQ